jgi:hypothetical protein
MVILLFLILTFHTSLSHGIRSQNKLNKKNLRIKIKNKCTKMEKRERGEREREELFII